MKIIGCGTFLPKRKVNSSEIDQIGGFAPGETEKKTGVKYRYYADLSTESAGKMAQLASLRAIHDAGIKPQEIDLIIGANATMEQVIPYSATLVHKYLGLEKTGIPTLDVNTSCLSFCNALEIAKLYIQTRKYNNILIVSSEIASVGLNYKQVESAGLFGDGAAAFIVGPSDTAHFASSFKTYSEGYHYTEIQGGGTKLPTSHYDKHNQDAYTFSMDGSKVFKLTKEVASDFMENLLNQSQITKDEIDIVIPHQASLSAIKLISKQLKLDDQKVVSIVSEYGNMIAASIPYALALTIQNKRIQRGNKVLLLGTSAGFSIGGIIFEY